MSNRTPGSIERHLTTTTGQLTNRNHSRRITALWADDPILAGWTPATLLAALADRHHPANPTLFAALVRLSQTGDTDATVLALAALAPGLGTVVQEHHHGSGAAFDELLTQTVLVLMRIDWRLDGLYQRIIGRVRAMRPLTAPHRHDLPTADPPGRATSHDQVFDTVAARLTLTRLATLTGNPDTIPTAAWRTLLATRIDGQSDAGIPPGRSPQHLRADASRLARRLARLLAA